MASEGKWTAFCEVKGEAVSGGVGIALERLLLLDEEGFEFDRLRGQKGSERGLSGRGRDIERALLRTGLSRRSFLSDPPGGGELQPRL